MVRISTLNHFWRNWLRSQSPRRSVISWTSADKACLVVVCAAVAIVSSWNFLQIPDLEIGMPAPADETAPYDAEVAYRDPQKQKGPELIQDTIFVQVIDQDQSNILKKSLKNKLKNIEDQAINFEKDKIAPVNLNSDEEIWIRKSSKLIREKWKGQIELAANRMLRQGLVNTLGFDELQEAASLQLAQLGEQASPPRSLGSKLLARTFHRRTNLRQDRSLQGLLEDTITKQSPPIKVKAGDYITRKGEAISAQDYFILNHYNLIPKSPRYTQFFLTFGEVITSCTVLLLIMRRSKPCLQARHGLLALGLMLTAQISKVWFASVVSPLSVLVPPTLLLSQGLGSTIALAWLSIASLLWKLPFNDIDENRLMIAFAVSAVIAFQGGRMRSRAQLLQMAFLLPFGALLGEWLFLRGRQVPNSSDELIYEALLMGCLLMLAILLIPILETTFGLITKARLLELADQERPLLRRLSSEAPGTFEHTLMICGLAEEGARSIGADVDLIRTGSLYHDVGKLHAPEWFIENQTDGVNPHDQLDDPFASADILQAHVDEGLKLARKYRLPKPIADFIPEHQGTLKMGYFLYQAKGKDHSVEESRFRYKGPIPRCRETGILMLADGCEAALRALNPKSSDSEARTTVRRIIESRQLDGQLKESSLTRAEVEIVIRSFVNVWRRMRHRRIPYPLPSAKSSSTT